MISYVKGILTESDVDSVVIEAGGIGYSLAVSRFTLRALPVEGAEVKLYSYLHVREDAIALFGFATKEELELFKLLITVSGVGPKVALAILSSLSPADLRLAIVSEDVKAIKAVSGVGPKTAQRVIIELKDRIGDVERSGTGGLSENEPLANLKQDVIEAMTGFGYSASAVHKVLESMELSESSKLENVLRDVLVALAAK